jgi:hypothetical protein
MPQFPVAGVGAGVEVGVEAGVVPVTLNFEPDPIPKNPVAGSAAALGAAGPIVTVATATAQANRIQCCLAAIR